MKPKGRISYQEMRLLIFKMKIIIKTTNYKISKDLRRYINEKIGGVIKKYLSFLENKNFEIKTFVEIGKITSHHRKGPFFRAECQLKLPKKSLRVKKKEKT